MREGRQVSNRTLRQFGLDSGEVTQALAELVNRGLPYKVGGRRYTEYLLDEDHRPAKPGPLDYLLPEHAGTARATGSGTTGSGGSSRCSPADGH